MWPIALLVISVNCLWVTFYSFLHTHRDGLTHVPCYKIRMLMLHSPPPPLIFGDMVCKGVVKVK